MRNDCETSLHLLLAVVVVSKHLLLLQTQGQELVVVDVIGNLRTALIPLVHQLIKLYLR